VQEAWEEVTVLQMDRSVRLGSVLLTNYRLAILYWAGENDEHLASTVSCCRGRGLALYHLFVSLGAA